MKIALISDTHGVCREELLTQIKKCDYLIHVVDFDREHVYNTLQELGVPMYAVRGNCDRGDWATYLHEFLAVPIGGKMFYLVHNQMDLPYDLTDADFNCLRAHACVCTYGKARQGLYQSRNGGTGQRRRKKHGNPDIRRRKVPSGADLPVKNHLKQKALR